MRLKYSIILIVILISCNQKNIFEKELLLRFNEVKPVLLNILSIKDNDYPEDFKIDNLIYILKKRIKNYSKLDKAEYNYIINNIKNNEIRINFRKSYSFDEKENIYRIKHTNLKQLDYINNIIMLLAEKNKNDDKIKKITASDNRFLNHTFSFYDTLYLKPHSNTIQIIEKESIQIDDQFILIKGTLYTHSNPFHFFSEKDNLLIIKATTNKINKITNDFNVYKIIINVSKK